MFCRDGKLSTLNHFSSLKSVKTFQAFFIMSYSCRLFIGHHENKLPLWRYQLFSWLSLGSWLCPLSYSLKLVFEWHPLSNASFSEPSCRRGLMSKQLTANHDQYVAAQCRGKPDMDPVCMTRFCCFLETPASHSWLRKLNDGSLRPPFRKIESKMFPAQIVASIESTGSFCTVSTV